MTPSQTLRAAHSAEWEAIAGHPFTIALAGGSLPPARLAWYLVQDYAFIDGFVRLAASAIATAPSLADSVPLAQFLAVITGPENTYFQRAFDLLDVPRADRVAPRLAPQTKAFQALMAEAAASGEYGRMIAVLTVAEWSYLSWATPHNPPAPDLPFQFAEWITLHAGPGFEAVVAYLRGQLDAAWERADPDLRARMQADFARAVRLERAFFDAAWQAG
ncbi:TenA family protein [Limibaculum sp. M0105]|uniref:Aminopyrimidine aminohydrolase n=1 Tax=Thermohalobaculum xanthum TaxID=2753746 RepID=A0A8J7M751_9RHOB|nr:TenA family protein [Thermohalobaculum xanthum]MBK0399082.1 TenA family protein [Thermohalobaculum xanthum]